MAKRKGKKMRGGAWYNDVFDVVKQVAGPLNSVLKATGIGSTIAGALGQPGLASGLKSLGYGRRRKIKGGYAIPEITEKNGFSSYHGPEPDYSMKNRLAMLGYGASGTGRVYRLQ